MLIFHKFVDVLRGASDELALVLHNDFSRMRVASIVDWIMEAEKFDFGELALECVPGDLHTFKLPEITEVEHEAWRDGLMPLPAPLCWYEYKLPGSNRGGLLVRAVERSWRITRFEWTAESGELHYDGHEVALNQDYVPGQKDFVQLYFPKISRDEIDTYPRQAEHLYGAAGPLATYLTLMINSRTTELRTERAPEKLNRARVARGRTPLADHRVVRIVPEQYLRERRAEAGITRLPPRLHWRRSHIRTLHRSEPNQRRILIPRCLVSGASEAEVSHEYRLANNAKIEMAP